MNPFNSTPDFILDLIFLQLNEEDIHETLRVSKSWFWASIRRIQKLIITSEDNPLKSIGTFYNKNRGSGDKIDWRDLFKHLVLDELIVIGDTETRNYLKNKGCNTANLTMTAPSIRTLVTMASLKKFTRLQYFEYCANKRMKWHPFIVECLKSSNCPFDPNKECPIEKIKLNCCGWNPGDPVLKSVTKFELCNVTISFLGRMVDHCPNLEELHCTYGTITEEWHHVFPSNVKRIELNHFKVERDVARVVNASTDAGRHLLPYLCQNWKSVEKFHFHGDIYYYDETVYEAFPQQGEEAFVCKKFNEKINLGSSHFECGTIHVKCDGQKALQLAIPPTKSVKLEFWVKSDFKFSPRDVCEEPSKVERLALLLLNFEGITFEPFGPSSFEGFSRLASLTLSHVSALNIKIALDQCPSVKKLKLEHLNAFGEIPRGSRFANVCKLVLDDYEEPMDQVFKVFPCLSELKYLVWRKIEVPKKTTDWLWRHLIRSDKRYGVVYETIIQIRYMVSDDLQASLNKAQKLRSELGESELYVKGFKLLPRVSEQKVIYLT